MSGRVDTLQAAILLEKLAIFLKEIEARQRVGEHNSEAFRPRVDVPEVAEGSPSVWTQCTLRLEERDAVQSACTRAGILTAVYYPTPLTRQVSYRQFLSCPQGAPESQMLSERVLSLPMHPYLGERIQDQIIEKMNEILAGSGGAA